MYEKIIRYIYIGILLICLLGACIQSIRVSAYEQQLEQYRDATQRITEYQQSIDAGLQSAQECISSATSSVLELREGLRSLEEIFINLENDNDNLRRYISSIDSNYANEEKLK